MTLRTPRPSGSQSFWATAKEYFVPPLVIPAAIVLAVVLFALIHGPMA